MIAKAVAAVVAFLLGLMTGPVVAFVIYRASNDCQPSPIEPCDGGPILAQGLALLLAPAFAILFTAVTLLLLHIRSRSRTGEA